MWARDTGSTGRLVAGLASNVIYAGAGAGEQISQFQADARLGGALLARDKRCFYIARDLSVRA